MRTRRSVLVIVFLAGAFMGSRFGGRAPAPAPIAASAPEIVVAPSDAGLDPWAGFDPIPSAASPAPACDETAQMMAAMFGALANQALVNAGKDPSTFSGAVASDRASFIGYLKALGIAPDDPQVEALLRAAFPTTSALPVTESSC